jgi:hypothetical protein
MFPRAAPGQAMPPTASGTGPAPVSTQATISGNCVAGIYDITASQFYSMGDVANGSTTPSGDNIAEAYQLTLTDTPTSASRLRR